jgi:GNAT superfamily N-acetyltransferase
MIRTATADDVPRIVEMGLRFRRETKYANHIGDNAEQLAALTGKVISEGIALVSEDAGRVCGMIGILLFPHFISGELIAAEVAWWVEPEHRGAGIKLVREAERKARERGAKRMQMIAPSDQVGSVYKRLGYSYVEAAYDKVL